MKISFETRQLNVADHQQVMQLFEERFATVIDFKKAKFRSIIPEHDLNAFRTRSLTLWTRLMRDEWLVGNNQKVFGSFHDDRLMSMVALKPVFDQEWVLSNLKARQGVPLSRNGLRETMSALYQHAKDAGYRRYYCTIAKDRNEKFRLFMRKLVPEYYNEYEDEILYVTPAGSLGSELGHKMPVVDVITKQMTLRSAVADSAP